MLFTLKEPYHQIEEIKKSRFITHVAPVSTIEQASSFISTISEPSATHNCWAWKIGQQYRFNDDGEPSGTAGRPILSVIEGLQCDQVVVLVIRWFGGIKLGTGGLSRAYGGCASRCLQQANLIKLVTTVHCHFSCYYNEWSLVEHKLQEYNATIISQDFNAQGVLATICIPEKNITDFSQTLNNLTKGRVQPQVINKS